MYVRLNSLYILEPTSIKLLPNIILLRPSPCKNIFEQARANNVLSISKPYNWWLCMRSISSSFPLASLDITSIASIKKPPVPVQVSRTISSTLNLASLTIRCFIWSGVRIMFLLSILPALERKILYAFPNMSCFSSNSKGVNMFFSIFDMSSLYGFNS